LFSVYSGSVTAINNGTITIVISGIVLYFVYLLYFLCKSSKFIDSIFYFHKKRNPETSLSLLLLLNFIKLCFFNECLFSQNENKHQIADDNDSHVVLSPGIIAGIIAGAIILVAAIGSLISYLIYRRTAAKRFEEQV